MEINLLDLEDDKIYIKLNEIFHKELFNKAILKAGSQSKLARILKKTKKKFAKDMKSIRQQEISGWYNNYRFLRLDLAKFFVTFSGYHANVLQKNIKAIKGGGTSNPIYNPKFPIILDFEMAQFLGKLCGDGCVHDNSSYTTAYNNKSNELIDEFKNLVTKKIGNTKFDEDENNGVKTVTVTGLVGILVTKFFHFNHSKNVPDYIKTENKEIKKGFLHSIFDDEGTVHKTHGEIKIKMRNYLFVKETKDLLKDLEIDTSKISRDDSKNRYGKPAYYFTISGKRNLKRFFEDVGFSHPNKFKKLESRLNSYKLEEYRKGEPQNLILGMLKNEESKTALQIAKKINRSKRTVHFHLKNLENKNLINHKEKKRKFNYEYVYELKK